MGKSNRVEIQKKKDELNIIIDSYQDEKKQKLLTAWLILWSLSGIAIITQFFLGYSSEEKVFMVIWLAFWAYFEFKVVKAFRWRKSGREVIRMNDETLVYFREIGGRGLPQKFNLHFIKEIKRYEPDMKQFSKVMADSYWVISGETLAIEAGGKLIPFGLRLNKQESNMVLKEMKEHIKEMKMKESV